MFEEALEAIPLFFEKTKAKREASGSVLDAADCKSSPTLKTRRKTRRGGRGRRKFTGLCHSCGQAGHKAAGCAVKVTIVVEELRCDAVVVSDESLKQDDAVNVAGVGLYAPFAPPVVNEEQAFSSGGVSDEGVKSDNLVAVTNVVPCSSIAPPEAYVSSITNTRGNTEERVEKVDNAKVEASVAGTSPPLTESIAEQVECVRTDSMSETKSTIDQGVPLEQQQQQKKRSVEKKAKVLSRKPADETLSHRAQRAASRSRDWYSRCSRRVRAALV